MCPESSGALKGLGENLYLVPDKDVCLTLQNTKQESCDMNIIMWLFSHLAYKEVYHIIIFICTACCLYFAMEINWRSVS